MCLLAIFYRAVDDAPLVVGANREEYYGRPGTPPHILDGPARALAGIDPLAGGTWLGVNDRGVLVAVTNRFKSRVPAQPRSRGLLVREMLGCRSAKEAIDLGTRELDTGGYAGCNVVCADADRVVVLQGADWLRVRMLPPGLHVLTNDDVNDASDPRLGYALHFLTGRAYRTAGDCLAALADLCAQGGDGHPPVCLHGKDKGTVSSTLVALATSVRRSVYRHAQGPPDRNAYDDYSPQLQGLLREARVRGA